MEVKPKTLFAGFTEPDELLPVISAEVTEYGWRGLTMDGEVLEVGSINGHKVQIPSSISITIGDRYLGHRAITNKCKIDIDEYLRQFNRVVECYRGNNLEDALAASDATIAIAPTLRARFNRAMVLLASGLWQEGFNEYIALEYHPPFIRPQVKDLIANGMKLWRGEDINNKRVLVIHAHGFGDTIQCYRYLRYLEAMGAKVFVDVPEELDRLFDGSLRGGTRIDYFIPFLHLLGLLKISPDACDNEPYLGIDYDLRSKWFHRLGATDRKRIGIAWSIGKPSVGDYPRDIELAGLIDHLDPKATIFSVQKQPPLDPRVVSFEFEDFADCAAFMICMDEIVTVDTAAVHLAGAIGHPNIKLLLSKWASWRWLKPWYRNVKICRQTSDGDWISALRQV